MKLHPIFVLTGLVAALPLAAGAETVPLKEAKLNIEHNATDKDTGFQGFVDSEGWEELTVTGPGGAVLHFEGRGKAGKLGLTELFFETVEPENKDVPIKTLLKTLPEGEYKFEGKVMENGEGGATTLGTALFTHDIPAGAALLSPPVKDTVALDGLVMRWSPVTETIAGKPAKIVAYQLIVEKDEEPHKHMIGKYGLSMYLPASVTEVEVPKEFLEPGTVYKWEVLAIEESGNQTLSSSEFRTQ